MAGNRSLLRGPTILLEVASVLDTLEYPPSLNTGETPTVYFMSDDDEKAYERIELSGQLDNATVEWNSTGAAVEETVTIGIVIYASEHGQTGPEALARAVELCEIVQAGFRNTTTGRPTGLEDITNVISNYRIVGYDLEAFPVMNSGWGVAYNLLLQVTARG